MSALNLWFKCQVTESLEEVVHEIIGRAQHLGDGAEEQDVAVGVRLQLTAAVLHWDDAGNSHAQLLYLREEEEGSCWFLKNRHRSASMCWNSSNLGN